MELEASRHYQQQLLRIERVYAVWICPDWKYYRLTFLIDRQERLNLYKIEELVVSCLFAVSVMLRITKKRLIYCGRM